MKRFVAIYIGSMDSAAFKAWDAMDAAQKQERQTAGMEAWIRWGEQHAKSIVDGGGPLGKTKRVDANGIADVKNMMSGYVIVEAESHEAAAKMFEKHPHFSMFPGESVEIMECLPIPKL